MNARNPTGPVGLKSPGRRAQAVACAAFDTRIAPELRDDPEWRRLTALASRAASKVDSLPIHARALRRLAIKKANEAIGLAKAYQDSLQERLTTEQAKKRNRALAEMA